jgi:hypothetical protein
MPASCSVLWLSIAAVFQVDWSAKFATEPVQLQTWLRAKVGVAITIQKPVFDISSRHDAATEVSDDDPTGPFIPDFLLQRQSLQKTESRPVIVETMGYSDAVYRRRKLRTQAQMSNLFGGAAVIHGDFHQPPDSSQEARDRRFWLECRWTIRGRPLRKRRSV